MATKNPQRNWRCPNCGKSRRAPEKLSADDARRFCLPCTETTGKLVPCTCPSVDRQAQVRRERAQAKRAARAELKRAQAERAAKRAAERERARANVGGFQLDDLLLELSRLDVFGGPRGPLARKPPALHVRRASSPPRRRSGTYWPYENRIQLTVWPAMAPERAPVALLSLLVSFYRAAYENDRGGPGRQSWLLCAAAKEAWPGLGTSARAAMPAHRIRLLIEGALSERRTAADSSSSADVSAPASAGVGGPRARGSSGRAGAAEAHPLRGRRTAGALRRQQYQLMLEDAVAARQRHVDLLGLIGELVAGAESDPANAKRWREVEEAAWEEHARAAALHNERASRVLNGLSWGDPIPAPLKTATSSARHEALPRLDADGTLQRLGLVADSTGSLTLA